MTCLISHLRALTGSLRVWEHRISSTNITRESILESKTHYPVAVHVDVKNLFGYNWYYRRKILKSMAEIPWEKVVESCGASFDCIRDIFIHSLQCEQFWIRLLSGKSVDGMFDVPFSKFANIKAVEKYADEVEAETNKYLKTLTDEKLQGVFEYKGWQGKTKRNKIEDILMHVIEEEIHHRGELLCIYWQNDITPPHTGYTGYVDSKGKV